MSLFSREPLSTHVQLICSTAPCHMTICRAEQDVGSLSDPEHFPPADVITSRKKDYIYLHSSDSSLKLCSRSTNRPGDDQLFPAVGSGWLSIPMCVQHMLFNPTVYHKVLAVSLEKPPLHLEGVSQFLGALLFSTWWWGDEIFNPAESLQAKSAFNYCPILRAEVKGQVETVHESHLSICRAAEK